MSETSEVIQQSNKTALGSSQEKVLLTGDEERLLHSKTTGSDPSSPLQSEETAVSALEDSSLRGLLTREPPEEQAHAQQQQQQQQQTAKIQRPGGSFRVVRLPGEYEPSENERLQTEKRLPEDTFSMVMIAPYRSMSFSFGMLVTFFQFATYILVLIDVTDTSDGVNPFGFPANVDPAVRIAQVIALIMLIPLQDEIVEGMILINDGYQKEALEKKFHECSYSKFVLSVTCRMLVGTLSIFASFLLIMIESQVLEIFFNFIALQFINDLDNLAFQLATFGIIGSTVQAGANEVTDISYFTDNRFRRRFPLLIVFFVILACWIWIFVLQQTGHFVSTSIEVQFPDELVPGLAALSGIYDRSSRPTDAGRFRYRERLSKSAFFGYCNDIEAWTFTYDENDPCNYKAVSSITETYEITETVLWSLGTPDTPRVPLQPFSLQCFLCPDKENPCRRNAVYTNGECVCGPKTFGRRCNFLLPCSRIFLDKDEAFVGPRNMPTDYETITDENGNLVTMYSKPVYVDPIFNGLIVFNGRRWLMTTMTQFNVSSTKELAVALENGWSLHKKPIQGAFMSDPSDVGTLSDSSSPVRLAWYRASTPRSEEAMQWPVKEEKASSDFDCAICHAVEFPCKFGNPCINGTCQCLDGSTGNKCQVLPSADGKCDVGFNTWDFAYDFGDCCRASCKSSLTQFCGYNGTVEVGFPYCRDTAFSCDPGQRCWALDATELEMETVAGWSAQRFAILTLSPNGRILVVSHPRAANVKVFDRVDAEWIKRGDSLYGPRDSSFGYRITFSTAHGSVLDFIAWPVDVRMAIGAFDPTTSTDGLLTFVVHVMDWQMDRFVPLDPEIRFTLEPSLLGDRFGTYFDFFAKGRYLVVQTDPTTFSIFDLTNESVQVTAVSCLDLGISCDMNSLQSVSENGSFLLKSSNADLFHVSPTSDELGSANWTVALAASNVGWSTMSRNGHFIAAARTDTAAIVLYAIQEDNTWVKTGNDLLVEEGWSVIENSASLSTDGMTMTFGLSRQSSMEYKVGSFRLDATMVWYPIGDVIQTESPPALATSYDASLMAVSDSSGEVRTFRISPFCRNGDSYLRLYIVLERNQNIIWSLEQPGKLINETSRLWQSPDYDPLDSFRKILEEMCISEGQCVVLNTTMFETTPSLNQSLISVRIDNEEVLHVSPSNASFVLGDCQP